MATHGPHDRAKQGKPASNTKKDPDRWKTGNEAMTGAQQSYLHKLVDEARVPVSDDLTKAEASQKINELQKKTGRGTSR